MKQIGVFVARTQPLHNGHIHIINQALDECSQVYVFVGSADKLNFRNPLPINLRMEIIEETYKSEIEQGILVINPLDDLSHEGDHSYSWGTYIFANMIKVSGISVFRMYYSDGWEIITSWFEPYLLRNNVSLTLTARGSVLAGLCATDMRKLILEGRFKEVKNSVPYSTYKRLPLIQQFLDIQEKMKVN